MAAHPSPLPTPRLTDAPWLTASPVQAIVGAIERGGFEARVVGGAVRNALMGRPVRDIDIATTAVPGDVMRLARAAGLTTVPTGLDHGTVTVVADHIPVEVTTLRRDVETFGRHAVVAFTTDWAEDAARRDFTINALYCDSGGTVHDPLGGYPDIVARRVRFIGDGRDRIREDSLRILRFFRFTAEYTDGAADADGLAAAAALKDGLDALSGERLRAELMKLLVAPAAVPVLRTMRATGVLSHVIGDGGDLEALARLAAIEAAAGLTADAALRLAALAVATPADAASLRDRLKLSNAELERLETAAGATAAGPVAATLDEHAARTLLYREGREVFAHRILLAWARAADPIDDPRWRALLALPARFTPPPFPVSGVDVLARGVPPGPAVGQALSAVEAWWIDAGFPDDRAATLAHLELVLAGATPGR